MNGTSELANQSLDFVNVTSYRLVVEGGMVELVRDGSPHAPDDKNHLVMLFAFVYAYINMYMYAFIYLRICIQI